MRDSFRHKIGWPCKRWPVAKKFFRWQPRWYERLLVQDWMTTQEKKIWGKSKFHVNKQDGWYKGWLSAQDWMTTRERWPVAEQSFGWHLLLSSILRSWLPSGNIQIQFNFCIFILLFLQCSVDWHILINLNFITMCRFVDYSGDLQFRKFKGSIWWDFWLPNLPSHSSFRSQ